MLQLFRCLVAQIWSLLCFGAAWQLPHNSCIVKRRELERQSGSTIRAMRLVRLGTVTRLRLRRPCGQIDELLTALAMETKQQNVGSEFTVVQENVAESPPCTGMVRSFIIGSSASHLKIVCSSIECCIPVQLFVRTKERDSP